MTQLMFPRDVEGSYERLHKPTDLVSTAFRPTAPGVDRGLPKD